jgi:cellobiose-specific phosphotransferase system component IIB
MTQVITDTVSRLDLKGYRGNELIVTFRVIGTDPLPVITLIANRGAGTSALASNLQPTLTTTSRDIVVTFHSTKLLPSVGGYQLLFDGRVVIAGQVSFSYETATRPVEVQHTILIQSGEPAAAALLYPSGLQIPEVASLAELPALSPVLALFSLPNDPNLYGVRGNKRYVILMDELPNT